MDIIIYILGAFNKLSLLVLLFQSNMYPSHKCTGLCKMTVSKDSSGHWVPPPGPTDMAAASNQSLNHSLPSPTYGGSKLTIQLPSFITTQL